MWNLAHCYAVHANVLENSKLSYEYVRIGYLSKYSKYAEGLLINRSLHGLPCISHWITWHLFDSILNCFLNFLAQIVHKHLIYKFQTKLMRQRHRTIKKSRSMREFWLFEWKIRSETYLAASTGNVYIVDMANCNPKLTFSGHNVSYLDCICGI